MEGLIKPQSREAREGMRNTGCREEQNQTPGYMEGLRVTGCCPPHQAPLHAVLLLLSDPSGI